MNMKRKDILIIRLIGSLILSAALLSTAMAIEPVDLNIARMDGASGIDDPALTLRWSIRADGKDVRQSSYAVRIAPRPDLLSTAGCLGERARQLRPAGNDDS